VLYALGEFTTMSGNLREDVEERKDVAVLLDVWKRDRDTLHRRFDLNQDGNIDMKEWELARLQAAREVRRRRAEQVKPLVEGVHLLRQPRDRRLFLLANQMPEKLGRRYWWWSLIHLIVIIGGGSGSLYLFGFK